jgi:demethylmenaquinone methyltransferase/2-methoxy-6-polyprenyl-1,4-benzoquinol methylase
MTERQYDDAYVAEMFDRMGPTYDLVNRLSSFGFCELWRYQCVRQARIQPGAVVCDMMAGSGECWPYLQHRKVARIISVDFSPVMVRRQKQRQQSNQLVIEVREENATRTALPSGSVDHVVVAFGLKTLSAVALGAFAMEIRRILKPGGSFSLLEISSAEGWRFGAIYRWYVSVLIPQLGRLLLGDIECYRMLGIYTQAFGSCERIAAVFAAAGLQTEVRHHFFGCATALVGSKPREIAAS